ncbi:hypothetical protein NM688_g2688 [Phlebia brevispora]|uniref:Uncharacterized protein n=1 Tax=Phlebia brevispora TaxID=194682 RepID=A0ACC1T810_9APHY|nr:hypothetical protein NM688_g2688 [Phlebia brevispora]
MLQPTTPLYNPRYDQAKRVTTSHRLISVGLFSSLADPEPPYLPPYWERRVQPEGSTYFVRDSVPKVITSADMEDSTIQENIGTCIGAVHKMLSEQNLKLSDSTELYLELDEEAESGRYYLVDHATRTLFWLESVETDELGIPKTVSGDHLRSALEGQYWQHVEYFPCHQATGLNLSLNELIHVFSQAQADHMTSDTSTFPYSAEQSKEIAQILTTFQSSSDVSGYARWTIARFWASVANYRTMNHHGQEVCRLSIDQSILESTAVSASSWAYELTSKEAFFWSSRVISAPL